MHQPDQSIQSPVDEHVLVDRARTNAEAFAMLYRQHLPQIHRFLVRRTRSVDVAEDLTASTFEKALRGLDSYRPARGSFGAWLHTIASNELIDHQRRTRHEHGSGVQSALRQVAATIGPQPDDLVDDAGLRLALDGLTERYRLVLGLRYFSDLDHDEAVAASGLGRRHFAVVLHRARASLRRALESLEEAS